MRQVMERYARELWYGRRSARGWVVFSWLYRKAIGSRWHRPRQRPPVPVIVVGNLSVGGTGKTPVVIALARHLMESGLRPAVISRGYGGTVGRGPERVDALADPARVGDEPVLVASTLDLPVWVGSRRRLTLDAAVAAGAEVVIADDGLQHRELPRSFEVIVVDGARGFGNGQLLPAGPLRCPVDRLSEADRVLLRGPCTRVELPPGIPFALRPLALRVLSGTQSAAPDSLAGQSVSAVCGIGHPEQFAAQLEALGMQVALHAFPDHHRYRTTDLLNLAGPIVTTAKDAIKLRLLDPQPEGVHVLEVEAALPSVLLQDLVEHVREFCS